MHITDSRRRNLLRFLCGSPLLLAAPKVLAQAEALLKKTSVQDIEAEEIGQLITSAQEAVNVFDFALAAKQKLSDAHWAFISAGADSEVTLRANRDGFQRFHLQARRLRGLGQVDLSCKLLGTGLASPIIMSPTGGMNALQADGALTVARAASKSQHLMMLSTSARAPIENVMAVHGASVWYQLYPVDDWDQNRAMLKRAEQAGCPVLVLTVDMPGNRERIIRFHRDTNKECLACHQAGPPPGMPGGPSKGGGSDVVVKMPAGNQTLTWDFVKRLQDATSMKLVIKGITTAEDAALAVQHGVSAIHISNHGGRSAETGQSTIESLPEIAGVVKGRIPIIIDSGFRRGTDVLKALAMGASAVGIGRPYLWALASFGQEGVEQVLHLLDAELSLALQQSGVSNLKSITRDIVVRAK